MTNNKPLTNNKAGEQICIMITKTWEQRLLCRADRLPCTFPSWDEKHPNSNYHNYMLCIFSPSGCFVISAININKQVSTLPSVKDKSQLNRNIWIILSHYPQANSDTNHMLTHYPHANSLSTLWISQANSLSVVKLWMFMFWIESQESVHLKIHTRKSQFK